MEYMMLIYEGEHERVRPQRSRARGGLSRLLDRLRPGAGAVRDHEERQRPAAARDRRPRSACATAGGRFRTALTPTARSSSAATSSWTCPTSTWRWTGRRAARPPPTASVEIRPVMVMQPRLRPWWTARAKPRRRWRAPPTAGCWPISSARSRDVAAAEDALAEAFRAALETWPERGVPDRPEAWLFTAARRNLIHAGRRAAVRAAAEPTLHAARRGAAGSRAGDRSRTSGSSCCSSAPIPRSTRRRGRR